MFTPKKKAVPEWTLRSHRNEAGLVPSPRKGGSAEKGKSLASPALNGTIPPKFDLGGDQEAQDWRSFREAGFLDESLIHKQDRQALVQKISNLENELQRYQYNMGLLLIEKKDLTTTYEDLRQELSEAQELLKREQTAHLMALSEVEKREENLKKALENGKHCAVDDANAKKEKELVALEEKLVARERVQNQKLFDEQNVKMHEFRIEMDQKRKVVDEELRNRVAEVELKEVQLLQKMETVGQREQALEIKRTKYEEKERELELKCEALREREKSLKAEETTRETEKKHILTEKENLRVFNDELDKKMLDVDYKQQQLNNKIDNLKVTDEEKKELQRLQSELRQKKDGCVLQEELFSKDQEALKQNKEKLEKEWKVLNEKKAEIETLRNQVNEEKVKFEKLKLSNDKRLKNENLIAQEFIQSQLEALRSKKASFESTMEHERLILSEEVQTKRNQMLHELELQKRELEVDMQNKLETMEKNLLGKEKAMKEESEKELKDINHSKEEASKVIKEMSLERLRVEKEMQEMAASKQFLEGQQIELRREIDKLNILVKKLKDQSNGFKEFLEKNENCKNCGEGINGFAHFDLHFLQEMGNIEISPLLRLSADYTCGSVKDSEVSLRSEPNNFHPDTNPRPGVNGANSVNAIDEYMEVIPTLEPIEGKHPSRVPDVSAGINEDKRGRNLRRGVKRAMPVKAVDEATEVILGTTLEPIEGRHPSGIADVAADIDGGKRGINRRRGVKGAISVKAVDEATEVILGTTLEPIEGSHPSGIADVAVDIDGGKRGINCRRGVKGANSVKAVDEGTENILGTMLEPTAGKHPSGTTDVSDDINGDNHRCGVEGVNPVKVVDEDNKAAITLEPNKGKHPCGIVNVSADINGDKRDTNPRRGVKRLKSVKAVDGDTEVILATTLETVEGKHPSGTDDVSAVIDGNKRNVKPKCGVKRAKCVKAVDKDTEVILGTVLEPVESDHPSRIADVSANVNENKHDIYPRHGDTGTNSVKAVEDTVILGTTLEPVEGKHPSRTTDVSTDIHGGKRGINRGCGVKKAKSVKAVDEDTKVITATTLEPIEGKHSTEITEVSADTNRGKCGIKPRRGAKRTNLVKAVGEDTKVILNTTQEVTVGKNPSATTDVSAGIKEDKPDIKPRRGGKRANSVKPVGEVTEIVFNTTQESIVCKDPSGKDPKDSHRVNRKSAAPQASGATTSEENHDSNEPQSVSVSPSGSMKRRQTVTRGSKEENRYNLRRR